MKIALNIILFSILFQGSYLFSGEKKVPLGTGSLAHECVSLFRLLVNTPSEIKYILERQHHQLQDHRDLMSSFVKHSEDAIKTLYKETAYIKERDYTKVGRFGISYNPQSDITSIVDAGDPRLVKAMKVEFFNSPKETSPFLVQDMVVHSDWSWEANIPGNMEGKWYRFQVTSHSNDTEAVLSQYGEPIPEYFKSFDKLGVKKNEIHNMNQVYYVPAMDKRPKAPKIKRPKIILEQNLGDMNPNDVSKDFWGTAEALLRSHEMRRRIEAVDGIEVMPVRDANIVSQMSSSDSDPFLRDAVYLNHWGYMGRGFGFSQRYGGVEGIVTLVDEMHRRGKIIINDEVFQHTMNDMKEWQYMFKDAYEACDITGCGNTVNLHPGSITERLTTESLLFNLDKIGFDGARFDLWGAVSRATAEKHKNLILKRGKYPSGEAYAYDWGKSHWDRSKNVLRDAGLWDDEQKNAIRRIARDGGHYHDLLDQISGGHLFSYERNAYTWKKRASDGTTAIETHDGPTLLYAMENDVEKFFHATAIQMSSQGDVMIGPGQLIGLNHSSLNDTPIDMFNLTPRQNKILEFNLEFFKLRRDYAGYFSHEVLPNDGVHASIIKGSRSGGIGVHHKMIPADYQSDIPPGELLTLFNSGHQASVFQLPEGQWKVVVNTRKGISVRDPKLANQVEGEFRLPANSSAWLVQEF